MWQQWVSSHYLSGTLPYVWCHITVNKMWKHFLPSWLMCVLWKEGHVLFNDVLNTFTVIRCQNYSKELFRQWERKPTVITTWAYFLLLARVLLYALSYRHDSIHHSLCLKNRWALPGAINNQWFHHDGTIQLPIVPLANTHLHFALLTVDFSILTMYLVWTVPQNSFSSRVLYWPLYGVGIITHHCDSLSLLLRYTSNVLKWRQAGRECFT